MTISSYPKAKLLVAVIAAITVGILRDSWGRGIGTSFIAVFLFVWVADWVFRRPIKGNVEVDDDLETLLEKLQHTGSIRNTLRLSQRGWCNRLRLFVQLWEAGGVKRLQAGGQLHTQTDAWLDRPHDADWRVKRYKPGDWEKLVDPTLDIASWISKSGGLPEEYRHSFDGAIEVFRKGDHLELPRMEEPLASKAEVLETVCRLEGKSSMSFGNRRKGLTDAEANMLLRKANGKQLQPSRELLEKAMAVADAKAVLPTEARPYLDKWGLYCRVDHLPSGARLYQTGGVCCNPEG